jgi:6,7-dimethyl-8-ribityllumazine synthase
MSLAPLLTSKNLSFDFSKKKIAIVCSSYHGKITDVLLNGAKEVLKINGVGEVYQFVVPGGYELLYGSLKCIRDVENLDGIITLGCVIKGDTEHDVYINQAVAEGLADIQMKYQIPIGFGLLTVNTEQQALDRSGGKLGNKGEEVAMAVLQCLAEGVEKIS